MNILIASESCIKCGKCVQVCPIHVFTQESKSIPVPAYPEKCIGCGHCVMVCPTASVIHELFPPNRVHQIDYDKRPSPESLMLLLKSRRSNRALSKEAVPIEYIEKIIEAACSAPTASNSMQVAYTVITDKKKLKEVTEHTLDVFEGMFKPYLHDTKEADLSTLPPKLAKYIPMLKEMRKQFEKGNDMVLRNAPAVIFIHAPKTNTYGEIDCNLAYQNGSLMAEALGVSQIYGGFIIQAIKKDPEGFAKILSSDEVMCAVMILGMPKYKYPNYAEKKAPNVKHLK